MISDVDDDGSGTIGYEMMTHSSNATLRTRSYRRFASSTTTRQARSLSRT